MTNSEDLQIGNFIVVAVEDNTISGRVTAIDTTTRDNDVAVTLGDRIHLRLSRGHEVEVINEFREGAGVSISGHDMYGHEFVGITQSNGFAQALIHYGHGNTLNQHIHISEIKDYGVIGG